MKHGTPETGRNEFKSSRCGDRWCRSPLESRVRPAIEESAETELQIVRKLQVTPFTLCLLVPMKADPSSRSATPKQQH